MQRQITIKIDSELNRNGVQMCTISKSLMDTEKRNSTIQTLRLTVDEFIQLKSDFELKVQ